MSRCVSRRHAAHTLACASLALLAPALSHAQDIVQRQFPANALRGTLVLQSPSAALLGDTAVGLAPGLQIRGPDNLMILSGALIGQTLKTHYTVDFLGQIKTIWILRADELARFWPRSADEAAKYVFDPAAQTWTKP